LDFFPADRAADKIGELRDWLKTLGVKDFERVSLEARALTKDFVEQIESSVDALYAEVNINQKSKIVNKSFELGERVVYVPDSGIVPCASLGTVIGLEGRTVDVVFDKAFMSGGNLEGRCSPLRGMAVYKDTLLNLTRIQSPVVASVVPNPSQQAVPARIPGKPLLTPAERQLRASPASVPPAPAPVKSAWASGAPQVQASPGRGKPVKQPQPQGPVQGQGFGRGEAVKTDGAQTTAKVVADATKIKPATAEAPKPVQVAKKDSKSTSPTAVVSPNTQLQEMTNSIKSMLQQPTGGSSASQSQKPAEKPKAAPAPVSEPATDKDKKKGSKPSPTNVSSPNTQLNEMTSNLKNMLSIGGGAEGKEAPATAGQTATESSTAIQPPQPDASHQQPVMQPGPGMPGMPMHMMPGPPFPHPHPHPHMMPMMMVPIPMHHPGMPPMAMMPVPVPMMMPPPHHQPGPHQQQHTGGDGNTEESSGSAAAAVTNENISQLILNTLGVGGAGAAAAGPYRPRPRPAPTDGHAPPNELEQLVSHGGSHQQQGRNNNQRGGFRPRPQFQSQNYNQDNQQQYPQQQQYQQQMQQGQYFQQPQRPYQQQRPYQNQQGYQQPYGRGNGNWQQQQGEGQNQGQYGRGGGGQGGFRGRSGFQNQSRGGRGGYQQQPQQQQRRQQQDAGEQ
ncbi:hypothetical protein HDU76_007675, partial [Blyttiomyces sp. JEL0837]